jgi:hypothetical protein
MFRLVDLEWIERCNKIHPSFKRKGITIRDKEVKMGDIARKTLRDGGEKKSVSDSDEAGSFVEIKQVRLAGPMFLSVYLCDRGGLSSDGR